MDAIDRPGVGDEADRSATPDGDRWPTGELILVAGFGAGAFLWAFSESAAFVGGVLPGLAVLLGPLLTLVAGAAMTRRARRAPDAERFLGWLLVVLAVPTLLLGACLSLLVLAYWRMG